MGHGIKPEERSWSGDASRGGASWAAAGPGQGKKQGTGTEAEGVAARSEEGLRSGTQGQGPWAAMA